MIQHFYIRGKDRCTNCRFCITHVGCPSPHVCIGCKACYVGCPSEAMQRHELESQSVVTVVVDNQRVEVPDTVTVKTALEHLGFHFERIPKKNTKFSPCETGGCYACEILVDGKLVPSCHTPIRAGQDIVTSVSEDIEPLRIVGWYQAHSVGGVGTPWTAKSNGLESGYVEAACFAAGCNLRCRTCQNYTVTYYSNTQAITPSEAAKELMALSRRVGVKRVAISGGEATLNRPWLTQFFSELNSMASEEERLHLDTNATILTKDYIDDLVNAGLTDIGPDLKAVTLSTFQTISGIEDEELAQKYLETEWKAVKYLVNEYYPEKLFVGVGLPFNPMFYSSESNMEEELHLWGSRILRIDERLQVTVLDYRPQFRRSDLIRPTIDDMRDVKNMFEGIGLQTVIAQTRIGHLPPKQPAPDRGDSS